MEEADGDDVWTVPEVPVTKGEAETDVGTILDNPWATADADAADAADARTE